MNDKTKMIKAIGIAGMILGGAATLIGNWCQQESMELMIEEKVNKAFAEKEKVESE